MQEEVEIIEEGPRICPLCSSEIKLFFINLNEKLLMCENTECEFPFGYEELQFVRYDYDEDVSHVVSKLSRNGPTPSGSEISTSGSSEIDRLNHVCLSEDSQSKPKPKPLSLVPKKPKLSKTQLSKIKRVQQMQKNVKDLKGLMMELSDMTIKNQKLNK